MTTTRSDAKTVCQRAAEVMAGSPLDRISPSELSLLQTAPATRHARKPAEAR